MKSKNINEIRSIVFEEIEKLRNGKTTPATLNAITGALGLVVNTAKLELEWAKVLQDKKDFQFYEIELDCSPKQLP